MTTGTNKNVLIFPPGQRKKQFAHPAGYFSGLIEF